MGGGGGKGGAQTIGYRYYMGIHQVICHGPVDSIGPVYAGERLIEGIQASYSNGNTQQVFANSPELFGGEKKEGGIQGYIDILFGDDSQGVNSYLQNRMGANPAHVPAFRGVVSAVCKKIYIAAMSPYPKAWWWTVTNIPQRDWYPETAEIFRSGQTYKGANPTHIIRDMLLNSQYGLGLNFNRLDDTSFRATALTLYNEGFSMSLIHSNPDKARDFIQTLLRHVNGILYQDRTTGLIKVKLIRGDYDPSTLLVFDESNILSMNEFQRPSFAEMVNEIILVYRRRGEFKDTPAVFQDLASIQAQGGVVSQQVQFPGIDDDYIASVVGNRELRQQSTPLAQVKITVNRQGSEVVPGDTIKFTWSPLGVSNMILRVIKADYGDPRNNRIIFDCVEDIFAMGYTSYWNPTDPTWVDPVTAPTPALDSRLDEATYYDIATAFANVPGFFGEYLPEDSYVFGQAVASSPGMNYELWDKINSSSLYEDKATGEYTPSTNLVQNVKETDTVFQVDYLDEFDLLEVDVGSFAYIEEEIIRIDLVDFNNNQITVGRGCLDTCPLPHLSGSRIWFTEGFTSFDPTKWQSNHTIEARMRTRTGSGLLDLDASGIVTLSKTLEGRPYLPFPPGNVSFSIGGSYPEVLCKSGSISATKMTWVNRNRLLQTVPGGISDFFDSGLTPEAGMSYEVGFYHELNLHGNTANRIYSVDSSVNSAEWTDEIADSPVPSFVYPSIVPDLDMPFYGSSIGGILSPVSEAQNIVGTSFSSGKALVTVGGSFELGLFSLTSNNHAITFDFIPDDLSLDRYQTLLAKQDASGHHQNSLFYDQKEQRLAIGLGLVDIPITTTEGLVLKNASNRILMIHSPGGIYTYLNGLLVNYSGSTPSYSGNPWIMGASFTTLGGPKTYRFSGQIGNLRIYNGRNFLSSNFTGNSRISRVIKISISGIRTEGSDVYQSHKPWIGVFRRTGWGTTWNQNYSGRI